MILYKYLAPERIDTLQRNLIRYTPPGAFNDPFESSPHIAGLVSDEELRRLSHEAMTEQLGRWDELPPETKGQMSRDTYQRIVGMVKPHADRLIPQVFRNAVPAFLAGLADGANSRLGILSLSERRDNLLMWAHYAASHTGLVIGIDTTHDWFRRPRASASTEPRFRPVKYSSERVSKVVAELSPIDLFFTKSSDWSYESEWRSIEPLAEATEVRPTETRPAHLFHLPAGCIREVILGCRALPGLEAEARALMTEGRYQSATLYRAGVDERHFRINVVQI
jgi:hypothetical protein